MEVHEIAAHRRDATTARQRESCWSLGVLLIEFAALVLVSSSPAAARPPAACARDITKLCSNVPGDAGEVVMCLRTHTAELTPECSKALQQKELSGETRRRRRKKSVSAWVNPCMDDIQKLCQGIPAGAGRVAECLTQHQAQLSDSCKAVFPPKRN
jgi:hypothetical protein